MDAREAMQDEIGKLPFTKLDWWNVVQTPSHDHDIQRRASRATAPGHKTVIGRHSRDVGNKWPSSAKTLSQCYPVDSTELECFFLGGAKRAKRVLGFAPQTWRILNYGHMDVSEYLSQLDIFVFFPHEKRIEPMARCVVEALAAGLPVLLPKRFQGRYGEAPLYCEPQDVIPLIRRITASREKFLNLCLASRTEARELFGEKAYYKRLAAFGVQCEEQRSG
jgi:hypothetical protein